MKNQIISLTATNARMPARILPYAIVACFAVAAPASAHFQQIIPSNDVPANGGKVSIEMLFTHPMERGPVMEMKKPKRFGAKIAGKTVDLSSSLKSIRKGGKTGWTATHDLKQPGAAVFFVEPQPYWEPSEGKYIIHYSKVVVDAFASGKGWDAMAGLPVEIEPLVRPTGVWSGNIFRGIVRHNGKPVPFAEIEVEFVNDGSVKAPNDAFVTQVIKADGNGVFSYAMPKAGWWGFAALIDGEQKMKSPDGKDSPVELGGLIWVKATAMSGTSVGQSSKHGHKH
jgi:cobalt/nickel transport protein